jgi:CubicO group peptidase (beta-lactamase class C family)
MQEHVLEPLGMHESTFVQPPEQPRQAATPHVVSGQPVPYFRYTALAAAGLQTTVRDYARFVAAGLVGPRGEPAGRGILTLQTVALLYEAHPEARGDYGNYGLGYVLGGPGLVGHWGGNVGATLMWSSTCMCGAWTATVFTGASIALRAQRGT